MVDKIIEKIKSISGRYSAYEVFCDWIKCTALSIANACTLVHDQLWQKREKQYLESFSRYSKEEQEAMFWMTGMLALALEEEPRDILGEIYMKSGMGSSAAGQFFTPYHLSELVSEFAPQDDIIYVNEPSCGGGGMIIALSQKLKKQGRNYQKIMRVTAQDLDWKGVYMCYVQLSLLGINAAVIQGDTLSGLPPEREHILYTPAKVGMFV